jgi:hypothetical protein
VSADVVRANAHDLAVECECLLCRPHEAVEFVESGFAFRLMIKKVVHHA